MKKFYFLAAAAATLLVVGCAKENGKGQTPETEVDDTTPVAVQFGVNTAVVKGNISTKAAVDEWTGNEDLYIYGIHTDGSKLIDNVKAEASPASGTTDHQAIEVFNPDAVKPNDPSYHEPFYYGTATTDIYDFYGYYVGNAWQNEWEGDTYQAKTDPGLKPAVDATALTLAVQIDGSQDLMVAKTSKEEDYGLRTKDLNPSFLYSAKAARAGVQPNLNFTHKLSRFVFKLKAADANTASHVTVTSISMESKSDATLDIKRDTVSFGNTTHDFVLKNANGTEYTDGVLTTNYPAEPVGESIMVAPGEAVYTMKVALAADNIIAPIEPLVVPINLEERIANAAPGYVAEAGKKYVVSLIVYGPQQVAITVSLAEWEEVGLVEIDPDDDGNGTDTRIETAVAAAAPANSLTETDGANHTYQIEPVVNTTGANPEAVTTAATDFTYVSSDTSKATVDANGLVTAVAATEANAPVTITVKYKGSFTHKPSQTEILVTVE